MALFLVRPVCKAVGAIRESPLQRGEGASHICKSDFLAVGAKHKALRAWLRLPGS